MSLLKILFIYAHLIATCFALASVLTFDFKVVKNLSKTVSNSDVTLLHITTKTVGLALVILWLTGIASFYINYLETPAFLYNPKIWIKIIIVTLLTLNGMVIHFVVLPKFVVGKQFFTNTILTQFKLLILGVISTTSWLYIAFLGIARSWSYTVAPDLLFAVYIKLLLLAYLVALLVRNRALRSYEIHHRLHLS